MMAKILETIMYHTIQMDNITLISKRIYKLALEDKIDMAMSEIQNRDRLVNIISQYQSKACGLIDKLPSPNRELTEIITLWNKDVALWISKVERIDQEITKVLEFQKERTTRQIATVFKSKRSVKGYNLSNVR